MFEREHWPCAGCGQQTTATRDPASETSFVTEFGQVDRVYDRCQGCSHVMLETLSGPGARGFAASRAISIGSDVA